MKPQSTGHTGPKAKSLDYGAGSVVAGKYRLLHPLGEGGMGSVWAAYSVALDINVALKLIRLDTAHEEAPLRLVQEARATARLADPSIVRMFDVGCTERGDPFIAMELLTGTTLQQTLEAGPLSPVRAVRLLLPIVRGLETAHRAGVVHRDIKPDNILFAVGARGDLQPKLVDFGVAKLLSNKHQLTHVGAVVGSPQYMSPEQARGELVDHRTDLWSLCVVLHEATVGEPPFTAKNTHALLHAISTQQFEWSTERTAPDPTLVAIIRKGLAKEREQRWQHARELLLALAEWLRSQGVSEDIAGVALRGRGLGEKSSLPGPPIESARGSRRRSPGTAVNLAGGSVAEPETAPGAAGSPETPESRAGIPAGIAVEPPIASSSPAPYPRWLWQAAAAGLCLLGLLAALAAFSRPQVRGTPVQTLAAPSALPAPTPSPLPSAEVTPAADRTAPPPAAERTAPPTAADRTEPPPAAERSAPPTAAAAAKPLVRRAPEPAAPRKAPTRAPPAHAGPAARSTPAPFKDPFE
jgi:serine/threonine protein kinase